MIQLIDKIQQVILNPLILLLSAAALLYFLYGVYEFIRGAGDETARATGRQHIIWGLVGLFIMASAWGLIRVICLTIGADCR